MADSLTIRLQTPGFGMGEPCCSCGEPASGFHGLPTFNGDIMSNDWPGDWGGKVCCEECYLKHERGGMETADKLYQHVLHGIGLLDGAGI